MYHSGPFKKWSFVVIVTLLPSKPMTNQRTDPISTPAIQPLQQFFETSSHLCLILRAHDHFIIEMANDAFLAATSLRRELIIGKNLFEIFPLSSIEDSDDSINVLRASLNRVLTDQCANTITIRQYIIPSRDSGESALYQYWKLSNTPVFDPSGHLRYIIHQAEHIIDPMIACAQRSESISAFAAIFEQAAVGLALLTAEGHWIRANTRLCEIIGDGYEAIRMRSFQDIFYPNDPTGYAEFLHPLLAGEIQTRSTERYHLRNNGHGIWVRLFMTWIRLADSLVDYFVLVVEDIQTCKEMEENLKEAKRLAKLGYWKWDRDTHTHTWSEEIYRIYGRNPALPPAIYPEVQMYFTEESWLKLAAAVEKSLAEGGAYECDAEVVRPDGSHRWITARGDAIRKRDGQILALHGTVQDITDRKLAEQALLQLNASLEARVAERTAELNTLNQSLESFVYSVSHDLKGPLRGIEGYSRFLEEDYAERLNEEGRLFVANIRAGVTQMSALIDDLLAYSRMERCKLEPTPLDLSILVNEVIAEYAQDISAHEIKIVADLPSTYVQADADGLALVLRNLLGNAIKFSKYASQPRIEFGVRKEASFVITWIRDNGIGFDMKYNDQIFEIFERLHRLEDYPGTGIGLALVKKAMQRMGGQVWADSAPRKGATFYLKLPVYITHRDPQ